MWILIEGLDRVGKSSVAEIYKKRGYEVIHMSAPDKKYTNAGYTGPSYLDDLLDVYLKYDGKDIVFDRSAYGEFIWTHVYGRTPLLTDDDVEVLREFEDKNSCEHILMFDPDTSAHWQRCVANNEPLTQPQFKLAGALFSKMADKYGFIKRTLGDYSGMGDKTSAKDSKENVAPGTNKTQHDKQPSVASVVADTSLAANISNSSPVSESSRKLEKANAISEIIGRRIIKKRGGAFDELESEISEFLRGQLESLLGNSTPQKESFSEKEMGVLKLLCQRFLEKNK